MEQEKRCGTCKYFEFKYRSRCTWQWTPGSLVLSAALRAGGEYHAMWADDGRECPTWSEAEKTSSQEDLPDRED